MELFSKLVVTEEKSLKMITKKFELSFFDFNRSEEHTSELQSQSNLVCRLLLEKKKKKYTRNTRSSSTASSSLLLKQTIKLSCPMGFSTAASRSANISGASITSTRL